MIGTSCVTPLPTSSGARTVTFTDEPPPETVTLECIPLGSASATAACGLSPNETARAAAPAATPE